MIKYLPVTFLLLNTLFQQRICFSQQPGTPPELTIQKIMQDPKKWIGVSPSNPFWSDDSKTLYFNWNPVASPADSLYKFIPGTTQPQKVSWKELKTLCDKGTYSRDYTRKVYSKNGDIYYADILHGHLKQLTNTVEKEKHPAFTRDETGVTFTYRSNLYLMKLGEGSIRQLTDFEPGAEPKENVKTKEEKALEAHELSLIQMLQQRKTIEALKSKNEKYYNVVRPKKFYLNGQYVSGLKLSPDEKFISFILRKNYDSQNTIVPDYITESGYTEDIKSRPKAGMDEFEQALGIYNIDEDTIYFAKTELLPGIDKVPAFNYDYNRPSHAINKKILACDPLWTSDGSRCATVFRSVDNKDRWLTLLDLKTGEPVLLDHQHDEAWIAGPGIDWFNSPGNVGWLPDNRTFWFQSEESGYSHLYTIDVVSKKKKALTSGEFEVDDVQLSRDKKYWYFKANINHPGDYQFYYMPVNGGVITAITKLPGLNEACLSPDEKKIAVLHSTSNEPWELFLMDNPVKSEKKVSTEMKQVTHSLKPEFMEYPWRKPELISFTASDSVTVYAHLYRPVPEKRNGAGILFVHGAGYLQNVHMGWSYYSHEYMFHNLLADKGYTVLDIDYRGSAGYGRNFRTAIYRHMGGKDLQDQVDGARYLVEKYNVDPQRIGIYGGSYGGFITLMAMFTKPGVFAAGAALRSVTDWNHYNHVYTTNILNLPTEDSLAYQLSSPIHYAEGLQGALLMCHGMVDTNVHFQDIVKLCQRLIELEKDNWELAVYPMENHAFKEASSWTDEYKRVLKLFEENLRRE